MAYEVPALPYDYAALEPTIDEQTMRLHHDKHHQAYVDKANDAVKGTEFENKPVDEVLRNLSSLPSDKQTVFRNNGGGHYNHSLFWESMTPGGSAPSGDLADAIGSAFDSLDAFKEQFEANGVAQFGSGWTWLVLDGSGALALTKTPNQDSPVLEGQTPLLGNDVWEHAYYLKYNNRRPEYLKAWWDVVNWDKVAERYGAARG